MEILLNEHMHVVAAVQNQLNVFIKSTTFVAVAAFFLPCILQHVIFMLTLTGMCATKKSTQFSQQFLEKNSSYFPLLTFFFFTLIFSYVIPSCLKHNQLFTKSKTLKAEWEIRKEQVVSHSWKGHFNMYKSTLHQITKYT